MNPLLIPFSIPPFSKIKPEHIVPAIIKILADCRIAVEKLIIREKSDTWESLYQPLAEIDDVLERIVSPIHHLNSVKNTPKFRKAYKKILPLLAEYNNWISHHKGLYDRYCNLQNSKYYHTVFNQEQKKAIDNILRDFRLSGICLSTKKKKRYREIAIRLSYLENQYSNNVLDATVGWSKLITKGNELSSTPESSLKLAKERAESKGKDGWLLTLDMPNYLQIMTYCENKILREEIYQAYNTRASDQGPHAGKWDNSLIMEEILALRYESAKLLGFESYAHKSLFTKMAEHPKKVFDFLTSLVKDVHLQGKKELLQLSDFAKLRYGVKNLQPWDIAFYSEKQKQHLYGINNEQIRCYFPENKVLNGLFTVIKNIYGILVRERHDIDIWHKDVRFFELYNESDNKFRGGIYLDLYTRENKREGAWMDNCVNQMRKADGSLQRPIAYLTCNFCAPSKSKPALFTHNEIITLFHEFGHVLHHTLTCIETLEISGINGVPWDVVELPSQLMENWCWEPDVLEFISSHYETENSLPKEILKKMLSAKNYQAAMSILRQIEFGLFDMRLHTEFNPRKGSKILHILKEIKDQIAISPTPEWNRFPHTFSHIFSGGYAAGYYSYLWSNVLSADIFSFFKKEGIFNRKIGQLFLDRILSRGGCENPMELFKSFLGREPKIDAMLEHYGINNGINYRCNFTHIS